MLYIFKYIYIFKSIECDTIEKRIHELEHKSIENFQTESQIEKKTEGGKKSLEDKIHASETQKERTQNGSSEGELVSCLSHHFP